MGFSINRRKQNASSPKDWTVQTDLKIGDACVRRRNQLAGLLAVADCRIRGGDVAPQVFAGDQTGRIVLAGVDSQTRAQASQGLLQLVVRAGQRLLGEKRTDVRVNAAHVRGTLSLSWLDGSVALDRFQMLAEARLRMPGMQKNVQVVIRKRIRHAGIHDFPSTTLPLP